MRKLFVLVAVAALLAIGSVASSAQAAGWAFPFGVVTNEFGNLCGNPCGIIVYSRYFNGTQGPFAVSNSYPSCQGISYNYGRPGEAYPGCVNLTSSTFYAYGPNGTLYDVWARKGCPFGGYMYSPQWTGTLPTDRGIVVYVPLRQVYKPPGGCQTAAPSLGVQGTLAYAIANGLGA